MCIIQNYAPVSLAKITCISDVQIIKLAPLTFIGAICLGGLVCNYSVAVSGNNTLGTIFNASSYLLTRSMWEVEVTLSGLII